MMAKTKMQDLTKMQETGEEKQLIFKPRAHRFNVPTFFISL